MSDSVAAAPDGLPDPAIWETLESRVLFDGRWAGIIEDRVRLPDGKIYGYTRLRPAGIGVAVAAFTLDGRILLEREYRHGVGAVIWQLPGGLVDDGETFADAGLRELLEETGYAPADPAPDAVHYLGYVWDNPGLGPTESHVVAVRGVEQQRAPVLERSEFITVHACEPAWLRAAVRDGLIRERTIVAAVAYLMLNDWL